MIICKCKSEPNRNDGFAKDGYSALCQTHKEFVDKYPRTAKLEEEVESNEQIDEKDLIGITKKYQFLKCW